MLAADLRLGSPRPIGQKYLDEAARRGMRTARSIAILSVVFNGEESQLTNLRAVGDRLPACAARCSSRMSRSPPARRRSGIPARGRSVAGLEAARRHRAQVGSQLSIGAATFRVTRVLISRPDQGGTFADLAPEPHHESSRIFRPPQLIQPGSRVSHRALFAGDRARIEEFKTWLRANKKRSERLLDITQASPQIKNAVDRAGRFLSLASLVSVLLCAIAVAMSARRYVQRHLDSVALLKTLGATRAFTLSVSILQLMVIAIAATIIGSVDRLSRAGMAAARDPRPAQCGAAAGGSASRSPSGSSPRSRCSPGFALPPLLQLSRVPDHSRAATGCRPAAAARHARIRAGCASPWHSSSTGSFATSFLFVWFTRGLARVPRLLAGAGALLVALCRPLARQVGVAWRYGVANLSRRRAESLVQIVAFGAGIMVLLLLGLVRNDLANDWRISLPRESAELLLHQHSRRTNGMRS